MAGDGEDLRDPCDSTSYAYDETKYRGFWRYYNSETPKGRAYAAMMNLGLVFGIGAFFYVRSKLKKE